MQQFNHIREDFKSPPFFHFKVNKGGMCMRIPSMSGRARQYNDFTIKGDITILHCRYKEEVYDVTIDTEDLELVTTQYGKWCVNKNGSGKIYLRANLLGSKPLQMKQLHRVIMKEPDGLIDHIDGDTLNNRKSNLRVADSVLNGRNRKVTKGSKSGCVGVRWHSKNNVWVSQISVGGKQLHLGQSKNLEEAIKLRKDAEEKYWGEYK